MSKKESDPRVSEICNNLREKISNIGMSEGDFLRLAYLDTIKSGTGTFSMERFIGRSELVRLESQQRPDKLALLNFYFDSKFSIKGQEGVKSDDNRDAAYVFDSEVSSRIALRPLDDNQGCDQTALDSVYSLIGTHREIIKTYRVSCAEYRKSVEPYLEETLRPFLSKWHVPVTSQDYNKREFREDLKSVQNASKEFLKDLRQTFSI